MVSSGDLTVTKKVCQSSYNYLIYEQIYNRQGKLIPGLTDEHIQTSIKKGQWKGKKIQENRVDREHLLKKKKKVLFLK